MFELAIPVVGAISIIFIYSFVLSKKYMRLRLLGNTQQALKYKDKVTDRSEDVWWLLTIVIAFLAYMGMLLFYVNTRGRIDKETLRRALFWGLIGWFMVAFIGYKIIKTKSLKETLRSIIHSNPLKTTDFSEETPQ